MRHRIELEPREACALAASLDRASGHLLDAYVAIVAVRRGDCPMQLAVAGALVEEAATRVQVLRDEVRLVR